MRKEIGRELREHRNRLGKTRADAVRETGLSISTIRRMEDGRPSKTTYIEQYAAWLGVRVLVSFAPEESSDPLTFVDELSRAAEAVQFPEGKSWLVRTAALRQVLGARVVEEAAEHLLEIEGRLVAGDLIIPAENARWVDATTAKQVRYLLKQKLEELTKGKP